MSSEELLYLEPDEEITTIIDRLRSVQASGIRLVVPKGGLVLQSLVSLKLLKREADRLRKKIALVTSDGVGLNLGEQANITVFSKPKDTRPVFLAREVATNKHHLPKEVTFPLQASNHRSEEVARAEKAVSSPLEVSPAEDEELRGLAEPADQEVESLPRPDDTSEVVDGIHVHHYTTENLEGEDQPHGPETPAATTAKTASILEVAKRHPGRAKFRFASTRFLLSLFAVVLVGFVSYLAFMELAPRATIALMVATEPFEQKITLTADSRLASPDQDNAKITARLVEAPIEVTQSVPATGKKEVGTKATGTLSLSNYWDSNQQSFPVGTTFRSSDGTSFVSTAAATIPGATTTLREGKVVTTPGKTTVTIEATAVGLEPNGKTGTFIIPSLPSARQDKIYGETTTATSGGDSHEVTIVSTTDLAALTEAVEAAAAEQGKTQLTDVVGTSRLLDGAYQLAIEAKEADQTVGAEAESVSMKLTGAMKGLVVTDAEVTAATRTVVAKAIPSGRTHVESASDTITTSAQNLNIIDGTVEIIANIKTSTALTLDEENVINTVAGQSRSLAETTFRATTGVVSVTIDLRPRWLKSLPKRDEQIRLLLTYQLATEPGA